MFSSRITFGLATRDVHASLDGLVLATPITKSCYPYNYLSEADWEKAYNEVGLRPISVKRRLKLYPNPANLIFGRGLHFIALLQKGLKTGE